METDLDLVIDRETGYYNRSTCTDRIVASEMIQGLYKGEKTFMLSSGMNAIYLILRTVLTKKAKPLRRGEKMTVLVSSEMYTDSKNKVIRLFKDQEFKQYFDFRIFNYNKSNHLATLVRQFSKTLACVFFEAVSNPSSYLIDFGVLESVPRSCYVIVDNTWMSPLGCSPFNFNVHCIVDSCSKYLSSGKCIAGQLTFRRKNDPICKEVENMIRLMGIHVSPIHCQLIQKGIQSLEENLKIISRRTESVVRMLSSNDHVEEVSHPLLKSHPCHKLWKKYCESEKFRMPGVVWFKIRTKDGFLKEKQWKVLLGEIVKKHGVRYATSFGKTYSLIDIWPKRDSGKLWLRLSIGYGEKENEEDLKAALELILKDLN